MKNQNHENLERKEDVKMSSDKSFGLVFSVLFFILAFLPILQGKEPKVTFLAISVVLVLISLFSPALLSIPNLIWFKVGEILRKLVSPLVLAVIFFAVITPLSLFLRLTRKDVLDLSTIGKTTYWTKLKKSEFSMKDQF